MSYEQRVEPTSTASPASTRRRGWRRFAFGMGAYGVLVIVLGVLLEPETLSLPVAVLSGLAPMVFVVWAMLGWLEAVRTFDELQLKSIGEAGLISLGVTGILTFTYGFMESFAGAPRLSMFTVVPVIALCYVVALAFLKHRYR